MGIAKFVFCLSLAIGSLLIVWCVRSKPWEISFYRNSVIYGTLLKFCLCWLIYAFWPSLNQSSDAALYYFPGTLKFLSGQIPYTDFQTSYSILFFPLLSAPVFIWESLGSVVLSMLVIETAMLSAYLYRSHKKNWSNSWIVAFLYCFSPISFYWVAMTGYNGVVIALFVMLALIFAEDGKNMSASLSMALSFLCCKLLAILAWPGIIFYTHYSQMKRALPSAILLVLVAALPLIGIDTLVPLKHEFFQSTTGNLWYLVSAAIPGLKESPAWHVLPVLSFTAIFIIIFILFVHKQLLNDGRFDRAVAFIATTNLLFMVLSKKAYTFYMPMALIFIIHTMIRKNQCTIPRLIPLAFLGATTTLEPYLDQVYHSTGQMLWLLLVLDTIIIGCYMYMATICFLSSLPSKFDILLLSKLKLDFCPSVRHRGEL